MKFETIFRPGEAYLKITPELLALLSRIDNALDRSQDGYAASRQTVEDTYDLYEFCRDTLRDYAQCPQP